MDLRHRAASIMSIISLAGDPSKGASGTSRAHELCLVPVVLCKDLASIMSNISLAGDLSKSAFGTSCAHEICLARIWQAS